MLTVVVEGILLDLSELEIYGAILISPQLHFPSYQNVFHHSQIAIVATN